MKKKNANKRLILLIAFLVLNLMVKAQKAAQHQSRQIVISGYIPDSILNAPSQPDRVQEIRFYNTFNMNLYHEAEIYKYTVKNNKFTVKVKTKGELGYFIFSKMNIGSISHGPLLVQSGDSLFLNIKSKKDVSFSGKGAEKMNYQLWVGKQLGATFKGYNSIDDTAMISYNRNRANHVITSSLDSLGHLAPFMNWNTYQLLKLNTISAIRHVCLLDIAAFYLNNNAVYSERLNKEIRNSFQEQLAKVQTDDFIIKNAFSYILYLNDLNKYLAAIEPGSNNKFETYYNSIKKNFSGSLRDKLLATCFLETTRDSSAFKFLPDALGIVKDEDSKQILQQMYSARSPGVKAYDFELEMLNGKTVRLADFKGKVVVMDTWYKGCPNCVGLTKHLAPVIDYFKANKNVVFLGVNVDKDKDRFIEGVRSGLYTSSQTINVYTNGLGYVHPMLLHYQYNGYPNLLLIDKNGLIISANPPRPVNLQTRNELIQLIKKTL